MGSSFLLWKRSAGYVTDTRPTLQGAETNPSWLLSLPGLAWWGVGCRNVCVCVCVCHSSMKENLVEKKTLRFKKNESMGFEIKQQNFYIPEVCVCTSAKRETTAQDETVSILRLYHCSLTSWGMFQNSSIQIKKRPSYSGICVLTNLLIICLFFAWDHFQEWNHWTFYSSAEQETINICKVEPLGTVYVATICICVYVYAEWEITIQHNISTFVSVKPVDILHVFSEEPLFKMTPHHL